MTVTFINPLETRLWIDRAICRGKYVFWVDRTSEQRNYDAARKLCDKCPVRNECLSYALLWCEEEGFWAGMTPAQRALFKQEARRLHVDWSNMIEIGSFRKEFDKFIDEGNRLNINWKKKEEVAAFRLTYEYCIQTTLFSSYGHLYEREDPDA